MITSSNILGKCCLKHLGQIELIGCNLTYSIPQLIRCALRNLREGCALLFSGVGHSPAFDCGKAARHLARTLGLK